MSKEINEALFTRNRTDLSWLFKHQKHKLEMTMIVLNLTALSEEKKNPTKEAYINIGFFYLHNKSIYKTLSNFPSQS